MYRTQNTIQYTKEPYVEKTECHRIKSINFTAASEAEILKTSKVEVFRGVYYDVSKRPLPNGLLDPKMGPANKGSTSCATCNGSFSECPGHFGRLTLALPVFNVGYFGAILDILKCICKSCSRVLLVDKKRKDHLKKMRSSNMDALRKNRLKKKMVGNCVTKTIWCLRCGYPNGKVKRVRPGLIILHDRPRTQGKDQEENRKDQSYILTPVKVLSLFKKMEDQDCELLYMHGRPENLLITNVPVPPMALRPSVIVDGGMSNENDITERLKQIIQSNASLRAELEEGASTFKRLATWELLQTEVAKYINSDARVGESSYMKSYSGFVQRLKGKQGRFRGNLSGKRVEYTGRTVISPDPNLKITEVAVPILMATILTYPERVMPHNIEKLRQCVRNGPKTYPGAKLIKEPDGTLRDLSFPSRKRIADELKFGYIVCRHLEDGDVVLFNRQPSLHRMSIMCHRARIMPWRTLRFNESVCNPYNADFDGDEMNLHVPQTEQARAEALLLMGVQNNLCTPKNGAILVASTQDFLTSSFLITSKDIFYDRASFALLCSYMGDGRDLVDLPTPALIKPVELWTGKQLFNVLLRPYAGMRVYVNLMVKEKIYMDPSKRKSTIKCQEEAMCPNDGWVYFRNSELISGRLGKATLGNGNRNGLYSVLLRDYNAHAAAACMNRLAKLSARWIGNHGFSIGIDDVQPGKQLILRKAETIDKGYKECEDLIKSCKSGRLTALAGFDDLQTLEVSITARLNRIREEAGNECKEALHAGNSPLIMARCGSKGSDINISQMVACVGQQAVGGRRAPDGFIERSLPHFPQKMNSPDAKGFVANSFYSGLTPTEFFFHTMGGREGLVDTAVKTADTGYMSRRLMKGLEDLAVYYDMTVRSSGGTIIQFLYGDDGMDPAQMEAADGFPLDLKRLRLKVEATCQAGENPSMPLYELQEIMKARLPEYDMIYNEGCSSGVPKKLDDFFKSIAEETNGRFSDQQLQVFLRVCNERLRSKRVEAGTAIGAISAQSIGEPGTQMTLKTFHFAGVASKNVTLGVPRIKEIINASKTITTPVIVAKLVHETDHIAAEAIANRMKKTTLVEVAKSIVLEVKRAVGSVVINLDIVELKKYGLSAEIVKGKLADCHKKKRKDIKQLKLTTAGGTKIEIFPETEKENLQFALDWLLHKLPSVVVQGVETVKCVIIEDTRTKKEIAEKKPGKYQLVVEGLVL
ncbi:DNA-directed RNA polymerase III subunit 1-like protein, partial [Drosera capensis]